MQERKEMIGDFKLKFRLLSVLFFKRWFVLNGSKQTSFQTNFLLSHIFVIVNDERKHNYLIKYASNDTSGTQVLLIHLALLASNNNQFYDCLFDCFHLIAIIERFSNIDHWKMFVWKANFKQWNVWNKLLKVWNLNTR